MVVSSWCCFFFQAEDGIRDLVRSRGLGDVYKRQHQQGVLRVEVCGRGRRARVVAHRDLLFVARALHGLSLIHI